MSQLDQWFERNFGRLFAPRFGLADNLFERLGAPSDARLPRIDVLDRDADVLVRAELPGVQKKDVRISSTGRTLTIRAECDTESKRREGELYRQEISHRSYERTIALPSGVDIGRARASLVHGMLNITLPKSAGGAKKAVDVQ